MTIASQSQVGTVNGFGGLVAESPVTSPVLKAERAALGQGPKGIPDTPSIATRTSAMSLPWPSPLPLEGVKSKKRTIFEVVDCELRVNDEQCKVSNVALTLGSRVMAIGCAGRALADVLLRQQQQQPISGAAVRHEHLSVVHLGPHLADTRAIIAALETRPQVVVLSDLENGCGDWADRFADIVHSSGCQKFKGAVVICVSDRARVPEGLCTTSWAVTDGCLRSEELRSGAGEAAGPDAKENSAPAAVEEKVALVEPLAVEVASAIVVDDFCRTGIDCPSQASLLKQVSELAVQCFDDSAEGDAEFDIANVALQQGWTVAALVGNVVGSDPSCDRSELIGYVTYNAEPTLDALYLARVAVAPKFRKRGYARQLMCWMSARARSEGYNSLWTHAVPALQTINMALGFAYVDPADESRPAAEKTSAWMELREDQAHPTIVKLPTSRKARKKAERSANKR